MADITLERCKQASKVCRKIEILRKEIEASYNTYHSPSFSLYAPQSSGHMSDPTAQAVYRIEELCEALNESLEFMLSFEDDLAEQVDDPLTRAIIRNHFILGNSWPKTTKEILEIPFSDCARARVSRYFKKGGESDD